MSRSFAISDIHGCNKTFEALIRRIHLTKSDHLFILGDIIDRGPDSRGVIDRIWNLQEQGYSVRCLRGNHEQLLLDALRYDPDEVAWLGEGGSATLRSFSGHELADIPDRYLEWIFNLPFYLESSNYLMVHAGLNFQEKNPLSDKPSLIWIRNWYDSINRNWLGNRIVIHGHTPANEYVIRKQVEHLGRMPVVNIDNGCVFAPLIQVQPGGMGQLCALEMKEQQLFFEPYCD